MFINEYDYDDGWGIDEYIIDYIKESVIIGSRVTPHRFYLFFRKSNLPTKIISGQLNGNTFLLWKRNQNSITKPDIRIYKNAIKVLLNGTELKRVYSINDITEMDEFYVYEDKIKNEIIIILHNNINSGNILVEYNEVMLNISNDSKYGDSINQSEYGWVQYKCKETPYNGKNQILVRFPLTEKNITINEEGFVVLVENQCWMPFEPYVNDQDLLVLLNNPMFGRDVIFEIQNKMDSYIYGQLVSQRFNLKLIEFSDSRYNLLKELET